ncbi:MAG: glycosyltransferase family 4 protein [Saprospiraceae bacterium]
MARILFLYSEMMPYMEAVITSLVEDHGDTVSVVFWDQKKLTRYQPVFPASVRSYQRSAFSLQGLKQLIHELNPQIVFVSGRMDQGYLKAVKGLRSEIMVVMGMDTQWLGQLRQYVQIVLRRFLYRKYFTHIWVPGPRQYAFARLLGYQSQHIVRNLYSGNVSLFANLNRSNAGLKRIVFLGRLEKVKGLDLLLGAWQSLEEELKRGWELLLIGSGSLEKEAEGIPQVRLAGFLNQEEMLPLLQNECVFCLPSRKEPWGVVVHEMAAAGMPLILSPEVGAGDAFLIHGYNGYVLDRISSSAIQSALKNLMSQSPDQRKVMGLRSRELSRKITPRTAAAALRSVLS